MGKGKSVVGFYNRGLSHTFIQFELPDVFDEESFSTQYLMMQASTRSALSSMEWSSRAEEAMFEHTKRALVYVYLDPI